MRLDSDLAVAFARVAIANIERPLPHKFDHLLVAGADTLPLDHVALHPAFFGSYDWHSAVHMHWLLVRVLRLHPAAAAEVGAATLLDCQLTPDNIAAELAYCSGPAGRTFERPYGWAWLLELRAELERLRGRFPRAEAWTAAVEPLARHLAERMAAFVHDAPYPIRTGTHHNLAFACLLALDHARACGDEDLVAAITAAAHRWYGDDREAPTAYEPSLTDFLSPILCEAAVMAEVMPPEAFAPWFAGFLPAGPGRLAEPPLVSDRTDPQVAHLDGLSLSRAWCLRRISEALPEHHAQQAPLRAAADANLSAGMPHTVGGDYAGEHWLASFAALALGG
jgi:hypothetical protein